MLQAFHLLNVWLLWLVARRLGAPPFAAAAACLFFGLHMALFDDFWKPMYIFDVLCATFCLLSLWCYASERWVLSFAAFWLAYKSKELAVMLPAVLLVLRDLVRQTAVEAAGAVLPGVALLRRAGNARQSRIAITITRSASRPAPWRRPACSTPDASF